MHNVFFLSFHGNQVQQRIKEKKGREMIKYHIWKKKKEMGFKKITIAPSNLSQHHDHVRLKA
jgi:hypothetical protein